MLQTHEGKDTEKKIGKKRREDQPAHIDSGHYPGGAEGDGRMSYAHFSCGAS